MKNLSKRFKFTLWVFGLMGQIAWVVENMYFNVFIYKMFHASAASISLMVSASAVTATVTTLIAGAVSDRAGRRKPFISGGYILWGLSILTFCLLRVDLLSAGGRSVAAAMSLGVNLTILMDCVMTVFGSTANDACFNAWLTESGDATNRGAIEGINAMMPLIAILVVFGGFMGFDLDKASSWVWIYGIIGVATILIGIAGIFTIEDTQPEKLQLNSFIRRVLFVFDRGTIWNHKLLYLIVGVFAIFGIAIQIFMPYLLLYYEIGLGMENYVLIMAPAIIIASILSVVYGRLYDQLGFEKSAPIAVYILLAGFALLYLTRSTVPVFIGSMLMMTGDLCGMAAFGARIREETPQEQTGAFQGIRIFGQVLIPGVIGPAIGAAVLRNADKVVGSDGTESFIPNANIFLAAFLAGVLVLVALELLFRYVRVSHHNLSTRYAGVNIPTNDRVDDGSGILLPENIMTIRNGRRLTRGRRWSGRTGSLWMGNGTPARLFLIRRKRITDLSAGSRSRKEESLLTKSSESTGIRGRLHCRRQITPKRKESCCTSVRWIRPAKSLWMGQRSAATKEVTCPLHSI